jgi:hypothetical protein
LGCNRDILGCDWKKSNDCGVYCIFSSYDLWYMFDSWSDQIRIKCKFIITRHLVINET